MHARWGTHPHPCPNPPVRGSRRRIFSLRLLSCGKQACAASQIHDLECGMERDGGYSREGPNETFLSVKSVYPTRLLCSFINECNSSHDAIRALSECTGLIVFAYFILRVQHANEPAACGTRACHGRLNTGRVRGGRSLLYDALEKLPGGTSSRTANTHRWNN